MYIYPVEISLKYNFKNIRILRYTFTSAIALIVFLIGAVIAV